MGTAGGMPQEAKYVRDRPARLLPGLAGADLIFQWIGMVEKCYGSPAEHWGPLPATRLASRKILIEQKKMLKSGQGYHSVYSVGMPDSPHPCHLTRYCTSVNVHELRAQTIVEYCL
jgi:hypothetical protein